MRNLLIINNLLLFSNLLLGQNQELDMKLKKKILKSKKKIEREWCEEGINLAIKDYSKGIRKLYTWGDRYYDKNDSLFILILKSEYGIVLKDLGCSPDGDEICYSDYMCEKIEADKGKDFFKKIREQVNQALK